MISVNISTIKQYFWYFDNFNKFNKNEDKHVLPVLKIKEKYYIFNDVKTPIFNENILMEKHFVPYDKQYSYKVIDDELSFDNIIREFENFICVFITVDDALKWTINKNELLNCNKFYIQSMADNELIQFNFTIKKKISKEVLNYKLVHELQNHDSTDVSNLNTNLNPSTNQIVETIGQIHEMNVDINKSEYNEQYAPPIPDPFWDDVVFVNDSCFY